MRAVLMSLAVLALCAAAVAAAERGRRPQPGRAGAAVPDPKTDPVLTRLGLTAEQTEAIAKLCAEAKAKIAELPKADPKPKAAEVKAKTAAILEELKKAIREALSAEQQAKYDAAMQLVADCEAKCKSAMDERAKAVKAAKGDKAVAAEAGSKCQEAIKALQAELEKALDEKVGKVGAAGEAGGGENPGGGADNE